MILYLDTNVILARYSRREPGHPDAKRLITNIEAGNADAVTSILTLVEIVSVTSRAYDRYEGESPLVKRGDASGSFLKRVANLNNLRFIPLGGDISLNIGEGTLELPALFAVALETGSKTGLKTLGNIHIASALIASRIYGQKMDYFVTLDEDIIIHREEILATTGIKVTKPDKVVLENPGA